MSEFAQQVSLEKLDQYTIHGVPAERIAYVWAQVAPMFHKLEQDEFSLNDVHRLLLDRALQLWLVYKNLEVVAVVTTEIIVYPRRKSVKILFAAGAEAAHWLHLIRDIVIPWGKSQGCSAIEIEGRPGWEKLINKTFGEGWAQKRYVVFKGEI